MRDKQCVIVLLTPRTCEEGLPSIASLTVTGRVVRGQESFQALMASLATDLDWTESGISSQVSEYYFSEPDYHVTATTILFIVYFSTMIYAILYILTCLVCIRFPVLSPPCQNLVVFGHLCEAPRAGGRRTCNASSAGYGGHVHHRTFLHYDIAGCERCRTDSGNSVDLQALHTSQNPVVPLQHLLHDAHYRKQAYVRQLPEEYEIRYRRYHGLPRRGQPQYLSRIQRGKPSEG